MKVLYLGEVSDRLVTYLEEYGEEVIVTQDVITSESKVLEGCEFIVSYGYRHIIARDVINMFPNRIVNMHISYLPWNRGADPNLWSFLEDSEKGVSIHHIDEGLDTGRLVAQKHVEHDESDTLRTTYLRLKEAVEDLLLEIWPDVRTGALIGDPQSAGGSYHSKLDKRHVEHLLKKGWDTPVISLKGKCRKFSA